jgi:hypothetical protein
LMLHIGSAGEGRFMIKTREIKKVAAGGWTW